MAVLVGKENFDDTLTGTTKGFPVVDFQFQGLSGNDLLVTSDGNDTLEGGSGKDTLNGGRGDDDLFGGTGGDYFVIGPDDGFDTIYDFNPLDPISAINPGSPASPGDVIVLLGADEDTIAGIVDDIGQNADGAVITYGNTSVTLVGVDPSDVASNAFITD